MANLFRHSISAPTDPETDITTRDKLDYNVFLPSSFDSGKPYGLVFSIAGYGDHSDSDYQREKLCPYLADKHNLIVVGVRYHNDMRLRLETLTANIPLICRWYGLGANHFSGLDASQFLESLFSILFSRNLFSLDQRLALTQEAYHQYSSFGFLPAIDHLTVLGKMLQDYSIDRSKIYAFGSSYGGYIASLMSKYAPNTFAMIIDNSGFSRIQNAEVFGNKAGEISGSFPKIIDGKRYEIPFSAGTIWSTNEESKYYFSDNHRRIRSLMIDSHWENSQTCYYFYHVENDTIAPTDEKMKAFEIISKHRLCHMKIITENDIDGVLFKDTTHAMGASLRKLFDHSYEHFQNILREKKPYSDFDLTSSVQFSCSDRVYHFNYSPYDIHVSIRPIL